MKKSRGFRLTPVAAAVLAVTTHVSAQQANPEDKAQKGERIEVTGFRTSLESALNEKRELTRLGEDLARLPIDPTLGRMLLQSQTEHATQELLIETQRERAACTAKHNPRNQRQQFARLGVAPPVEDCENIAGAENGSRPGRRISGAAHNKHHHGNRQSPASRQAALGGPKRERAESSEQPLPKCEVRHCECRVTEV